MNENKSDSNANAKEGGEENLQEPANSSFREKVIQFFRKKWILRERKDSDKSGTPAELAEFSFWDYIFLGIAYLFLFCCYSTLLIQLLPCVPNKLSSFLSNLCFLFAPNPNLIYIVLFLAPFAWLVHFIIRLKRRVYDFRLEDPAEVNALIVEAESAIKRSENKPNLSIRRELLKTEADRVNELGHENWTDYQILNLDRMLVDFLKPDDLKARAKSRLEELQEYWVGTADRFEPNHFEKWRDRINKACDEIDRIKGDEIDRIKEDELEEKSRLRKRKAASIKLLRADLRMLMEHVTDWDCLWAEGSAAIISIIRLGVIALLHFFGIGLLPLIYNNCLDGGDVNMCILNMSMLGVCGSLTAVLLKIYHKYGSDEAEVGVTKGRVQLNLALLGTSLGLVAGILFYALVAGEILKGPLFPSFPLKNDPGDIAKAIFWGFAAGFSFERIFNRVRDISSKEL